METSSAETRSKEVHAETVSSDCREGTSAPPTENVNTDDGETASAVGRFDQPGIDEEHQHEITSQTHCQRKEDLLNGSIEDVCVHSDTHSDTDANKEMNNFTDDKTGSLIGDEECDRSKLSEGDKVCLRKQTDAGKEMNNFTDDKTGSLSGDEKSDRSMLSKGDEVCLRTQTDAGKEMNNFTGDKTGSLGGDEKSDRSMLSEDDKVFLRTQTDAGEEISNFSDDKTGSISGDEESDRSKLSEGDEVCVRKQKDANKEMNNFTDDKTGSLIGDEECDRSMLSKGDEVCLRTQTDAGKEMNNFTGDKTGSLGGDNDDETGSISGDEETDRSKLSEGDKVCLRTQTDAGKEMNNFTDDETGSLSGVEETDCSMLSEDDESSHEDRHKFPVITDIPSTVDQANITSKSCESLILFDSDNTVDEAIDKEDLEIDRPTTYEQDNSTQSISKPLSVDNKARGTNHGHTMKQEAIKKYLSSSTESSEGPASSDNTVDEAIDKEDLEIDRSTTNEQDNSTQSISKPLSVDNKARGTNHGHTMNQEAVKKDLSPSTESTEGPASSDNTVDEAIDKEDLEIDRSTTNEQDNSTQSISKPLSVDNKARGNNHGHTMNQEAVKKYLSPSTESSEGPASSDNTVDEAIDKEDLEIDRSTTNEQDNSTHSISKPLSVDNKARGTNHGHTMNQEAVKKDLSPSTESSEGPASSDNTVDEAIDKEDLEIDRSTTNEQDNSTQSISKPLSVDNKARGNNHGHTMNQEAVKKDLSPSTESFEGPASSDNTVDEAIDKEDLEIDRSTTNEQDNSTQSISKPLSVDNKARGTNHGHTMNQEAVKKDLSPSTESSEGAASSDSTVDVAIDKEDLEIDRSTTNEQDNSTQSISKPPSVDNKARGNNHGHTMNQEAFKKDLSPSTESSEGPTSIDANSTHTNETATKYIISSMDCQPITLFTTSSEDSDTNDEVNEVIIKKEMIEYLTGIVDQISDESEGTEDPVSLEAINNEVTAPITEEKVGKNSRSTSHKPDGLQTETIENIESLDAINNNETGGMISKDAGAEYSMIATDQISETNITSFDATNSSNEIGCLISKEAGGKDRILANDHTSENEGTNSFCNSNDTSNSLDIIDNNNEMRRLISKEACRDDRILANDHTSETGCAEEEGVGRHPPRSIAQKYPLPIVTKVSDSKIDGILSEETVLKLITNNQSCQTGSTQVHTGVNNSLSHNKVDDTSFIGKDPINEGLITGQPDCPSKEIDENPLNIDMSIIGKNSIIKDILCSKKDTLAASDISTGIQTSSDKGNLMGKHITCNTATTASQTHRPSPVNGVCTMNIDKTQSKVVGIVNALRKIGNVNTRVRQRSTSDLVNWGHNANNQNDTSILPKVSTTPLQNTSDFPNPDNQTSSNDLVNPSKTNQAHQNNVPSSNNINYLMHTDNTQNQIVATSSPLGLKISDVRSLADNAISSDPLNYANVYHTVKKEPITKDRPSAELPSTNKQASSVGKSSSPPINNNIISTIESLVHKFGNLQSVTIYPDFQNDGKNNERNTSHCSGASNCLPLGNIRPSSKTLHTSGTANSSEEREIVGLNGQYIEIDNKSYFIYAHLLPRNGQNETNHQSRTEFVYDTQTNLSMEIVNLAAKNACGSERGCINRPGSQINKEQSGCTVESRDGQRNGQARDQEHFKTASKSSKEGIKVESTVSKASCSYPENTTQLGCVSNRCEHFTTNNRKTGGTNSFGNCHLNNPPTSPKEELEGFLLSSVTHDHCYSVNDTTNSTPSRKRSSSLTLSPPVSKKRNTSLSNHRFSSRLKTKEQRNAITHDHCYSVSDTTNLFFSRIRSSILSLSHQVSKNRKAALLKRISVRLNTKEQQNVGLLQNHSNREQLPTAMQNRPSDKRVFYENEGSNQANRNAHQPIPARLEIDEQQNLGLQQNSSNRINEQMASSQEEFSNSTPNDNFLNQGNRTSEEDSCSSNCTIYEKDTACLNVSLIAQGNGNKDAHKNITQPNNIVGVWKASDKKDDNGTPHSDTSFPQILTTTSSSLPQTSSCQSGESLAISGSPNSTSQDDRSFVRSPSIFEFLRPNSESLTQDGDTCSSLEKNRWSSTDESSEESRKCFSAVDGTEASNSMQDSMGFTEKKYVRLDLDHSIRIIDEPTRCKDPSRIICNDQTKRTDLTGNSKTLTKKGNTDLGVNNSVQVAEKSTGYKDVSETTCNTKSADPLENSKQLTKSEVLVETREHLSTSSHLIRKVSYKRKRTGLFDSALLKLSNSADGIHSNKRSRVEHDMQSSPIGSQSSDASKGSKSEVQPSEVQVAEVHIPQVHNAEVQIPEVRNAEEQLVHNSEAQNRNLHNSEVPNSELQKSTIETPKVLNAEIQTSVIQSSEIQSSEESPNPGEESEETVQCSEESSCWEPRPDLLSHDVLSFEEETPSIQSSEVQNSEESPSPGEESGETVQCSEESSCWEPSSETQSSEESSNPDEGSGGTSSWGPRSSLLSQDVLISEEQSSWVQSAEVSNFGDQTSQASSSEEQSSWVQSAEISNFGGQTSQASSSEEQSSWIQSAEVSNFGDQTSGASNFEGQSLEYVKVEKGEVPRPKGQASSMLSNKKSLNSKSSSYGYSSCPDFQSQKMVRKIKKKYTRRLRPIIYTRGKKRYRSIPGSQTRKARRKRKETSLLEDDLPLSEWRFLRLRNLSEKSSSCKRKRLTEGTIASTSARKCDLDAVVKLVKLDAVVKLLKLKVRN